jgi:zinc/manganese transport system substrate-binding protein
MKKSFAALCATAAMALVCASARAQGNAEAASLSTPVPVVAAENFYGDVVQQLGGKHVAVTSVLSNPDQDPHLFEASPSTARALSHARLVVYNGADYDPWMAKLLSAAKSTRRTTIVAASLIGKKAGDNPHLWYAPQTMPAVAHAVTDFLKQADPANSADYDRRLGQFLDSLKPIDAKVAALRAKYAATPVTATEPVFGYMAEAIGLDMRNQRFQLAAMNDTEPSASDVGAFETDLRRRTVKILIYNSQASDETTRRMLALARKSGVATIHVTETEPGGMSYQKWMLTQLNALEHALQGSAE